MKKSDLEKITGTADEARAEPERLGRKEKAAEAHDRAMREAEQRAAELKQRFGAGKRVYVVKSGDSLGKIAKEVYGDANRWPEIFEANKDTIKDPNLIHPGQELQIP